MRDAYSVAVIPDSQPETTYQRTRYMVPLCHTSFATGDVRRGENCAATDSVPTRAARGHRTREWKRILW